MALKETPRICGLAQVKQAQWNPHKIHSISSHRTCHLILSFLQELKTSKSTSEKPWEHPTHHLPSCTGSSMLPITCVFPTLFWETQCLDTYSLTLADSPVPPRRSTILLISDFYCFSPYLPAPIFPHFPHPLLICRAQPPRGLATPLWHQQWITKYSQPQHFVLS